MGVRMVLNSLDSMSTHANNVSHDFRVHLPRHMSLLGYWSVALTEITIEQSLSDRNRELFVYSNLCDDTIVGERESPLL